MNTTIAIIMATLVACHYVFACKLKLWNIWTSVALTFALIITPLAVYQSF